jgi:hypothetical protein
MFMLPRSPLPGFIASALLATAFFALPATAATHIEVQGGRSYMDSHPTNAFFIESVFNEYRIGDSNFSWSPDVSLGWINGRDGHAVRRYATSNPSTTDDVWLLAGGARFHMGNESDWYHPLFLSAQVAGTSGSTQALSSHYEFVTTIGWQWKHLSFQVRHISNASLHEPNRGETMALVGVGFDL